jgi:hypothetical protein
MQPQEIISKGRKSKEVVGRSLLCFWAARELGLSLTELARHLEMTVAGIGYPCVEERRLPERITTDC